MAKIEGCEEYYALSDDGATCYQDRTLYEEPIVTCSDGFEVAGDICIESLQHEPSYECDDVAWTLVDDICYEDILNTEDSAAQVCPDSYVDTGTDCHLYIEVEPVIACEPGYLYSDGAQQCEKAEVVKELPQSACPVGSEDLGNGYCKTVIASATPIIECEGAINPATHQCEVAYTDEISPGYCNAPFSKEDDQCVQSRSKLPTATCPAGTTQSVTHCVSTQVETAIPTEECSGG